MEALVAVAREAHLKAQEHDRLAGHFRAQRNQAIRRLYADGMYSYTTLAKQVELPRELVVKILQNRTAS